MAPNSSLPPFPSNGNKTTALFLSTFDRTLLSITTFDFPWPRPPKNDGTPPPLRRRPPPRVLLLRHPHHFSIHSRPVPDSSRFLKPWESPLPFDDFLSSADARSAEAIVTSGGDPVTADLLRRLPEVRPVVTTSAGLNHIDLAECRTRGVAVAGAGDTKSEEVADLAVGLLIDVLRKVSASDRYVRRGLWISEGEFALGSKVEDVYIKRIGRLVKTFSSLGRPIVIV